MLRGVRIDQRTLEPYFTWGAGRYTRNLVHRDEAFELTTPIPDCAFVLQRGAITCDNYRIAGPDGDRAGPCELRRTSTRTLREGEIHMRSGHLSVHRVGACDGRAITLHVYAKPIDACRVCDEDGTSHLARSRYRPLVFLSPPFCHPEPPSQACTDLARYAFAWHRSGGG